MRVYWGDVWLSASACGFTEIDYVLNQEPVENRDFDAIEREMTAIADFCREPPYPSRMLIEEHFLKKILAKAPNPVYLKEDRSGGRHLIEHIQFQFSACKRKKIGKVQPQTQ